MGSSPPIRPRRRSPGARPPPRAHETRQVAPLLRQTPRWRGQRLLRRRTAIERDWSQLKHVFLLDPLPVVGLVHVQVSVSLVMVAYLAAVTYDGSMRRSLRAIKSLVA